MHYRVQPWAHQLRAIELAKGKDCLALFFEQGTGKTSTCINILRDVYNGRVRRTLILCPQIVIENWRREFEMHSEVPAQFIHMLTGSGKDRERQILSVPDFLQCVFITNYEALRMDGVRKCLLAWSPEVMVLDESHRCKSLSSKTTKYALELGRKAKNRYILSGTPIVNSPEDIFSQYLFLDQGLTFGANYFEFRKEYFRDRNASRPKQTYFPDWVPKEGALERINAAIYTKALRVKKDECLDLPPFIRQFVSVELSDEQKRVYRALEKDAVAEFQQEILSADLAIKKALRLQQLVTGYVRTDDEQIRSFDPNPRIDALNQIIDQIGPDHKIIIWAVFKQNYEDIRRLLRGKKIIFTEIHGEVPPEHRQRHVDSFNSRTSQVRVLLAHPASAGTGVNLVAAAYAIFYSRGFSLEQDLQAEARNYRGGSEVHTQVVRIDLVTRNTVDEVVLAALADKVDVSERILKHMRGKR